MNATDIEVEEKYVFFRIILLLQRTDQNECPLGSNSDKISSRGGGGVLISKVYT